MRLDIAEYKKNVKVFMVPHLEGPVTPDTHFHVYTHGLSEHYGLSELEVTSVPAAYVEVAGAMLNRWAVYQIETGRRIKPRERLQNEGSMLIYQAERSPYPPKGADCLRLVLAHVNFSCSHCSADN